LEDSTEAYLTHSSQYEQHRHYHDADQGHYNYQLDNLDQEPDPEDDSQYDYHQYSQKQKRHTKHTDPTFCFSPEHARACGRIYIYADWVQLG
jgi:hypothetical protein